jgi:hypothetical protein
MESTDTIVTLPAIERAHQLAAHCLRLRCLGAICGPNGVGKTVALRSIESKFPTMGVSGKCVYYRAFYTDGYTRGARDLLVGLGVRSSQIPSGASLQLVSKVALREFRAQQIRLLLIDEADSWSLDSMRGMISVMDAAAQADLPLSVIFAGDSDLPKWLGQHGAGISRTLQIDLFQNLPLDLTLAVLRQWGAPFQFLAEQISQKDKEARLLAKRILQATGGNLRRLNFFARLYLAHFPEAPITADHLEVTFAQMLIAQ